jgi:DNA-binding CsgD family transcriptional regulator
MRLSVEEVERLLHISRDATLGGTFQERFSAIGDALSALIPNTSLSTMVVDPASGDESGTYLFFRNGDPSNLRDYLVHYMPGDPLAAFVSRADGNPYVLSEHLARPFGKDAFSGEFLARHDPPIRYIMSCPKHAVDGKLLMLSFQRERRLGDFGPRERAIVRLVAPDLARAATAIVLGDKVKTLAGGPAGAGAGAIVFTEDGEVLHADAAALVLAGALGRGGLPHEALLTEVRAFAATGKTAGELVLGLADGSRVRVRLSRGEADPRGRSVVVFLERLGHAAGRFATMCESAGLSGRERQAAELALAGLGNRGIAMRLGISIPTVSVYLSRAYAKIGVSGRTELAALVLRWSSRNATDTSTGRQEK